MRCMFQGCGIRLDRDTLSGEESYFGYLAHIVPASESGPRGNQARPGECERLADVAENIMLLCDKCHRLIDRVAVSEYPRERLEAMRKQFLEVANDCLSQLSFRDATSAFFLWPIGGHFVSPPSEKGNV